MVSPLTHALAHDEYSVKLDAFEGPLDLLLYLIRRSEVDLHDIPVSQITGQYMAYLEQIHSIDIEQAGEFLVMAATLMEIKSRMLAPAPEQAQGESGPDGSEAAADPRAELVQQLVAYKRFRDAAGLLERRMQAWEGRFGAAAAGLSVGPASGQTDEASGLDDRGLDLGDLDLIDLVQAFGRIIETIDLQRVGDHRVVDDETPIEVHAADLVDRLSRDGREMAEFGSEAPSGGLAFPRRGMRLRELLTGRSRAEAIGLFLAMLELVRQRRLAVRQDAELEVLVALREPEGGAATGV
jgi:segregation and condensation protein A